MSPHRAFASTLVLTFAMLFSSHVAISQMSVEQPVDPAALPELNTQMFTVEKQKPVEEGNLDFGRSADSAVSAGAMF